MIRVARIGQALGWAAFFVAGLAAASQRVVPDEDGVRFRDLVQQYQMFVVPHCAPKDVAAYNAKNARRDADFEKSLKRTSLLTVYKKAVSDQAERDAGTVYECFGPPPPPPPPGVVLSRDEIEKRWAVAEQQRVEREKEGTLAHFREGDATFAKMLAMRDAILKREKK